MSEKLKNKEVTQMRTDKEWAKNQIRMLKEEYLRANPQQRKNIEKNIRMYERMENGEITASNVKDLHYVEPHYRNVNNKRVYVHGYFVRR